MPKEKINTAKKSKVNTAKKSKVNTVKKPLEIIYISTPILYMLGYGGHKYSS